MGVVKSSQQAGLSSETTVALCAANTTNQKLEIIIGTINAHNDSAMQEPYTWPRMPGACRKGTTTGNAPVNAMPHFPYMGLGWGICRGFLSNIGPQGLGICYNTYLVSSSEKNLHIDMFNE